MHAQDYKEQLHASYEWYRTMRSTQPVFKDPDWGGWHAFRYDDISSVTGPSVVSDSPSSYALQCNQRDLTCRLGLMVSD